MGWGETSFVSMRHRNSRLGPVPPIITLNLLCAVTRGSQPPFLSEAVASGALFQIHVSARHSRFPSPHLNHIDASVPLLKQTDSGSMTFNLSTCLPSLGSSALSRSPPALLPRWLAFSQLNFSFRLLPPGLGTCCCPAPFPSSHSLCSPASSHSGKRFLLAAVQKLHLCIYCYVYLSVDK